jgi:phosphoribosyl 1,2-cyclic phosphodiesterase
VQFVVGDGAHRLGVLTDLGGSTPYVEASLTGCDALVLECNHDLDLLAQSSYPHMLKQRIAGPFGHLHNEASAQLLARLDTSKLQHIIAAHLSQHNNTPDKARAALAGALDCAPDWIGIADQSNGFDWRQIG